MGENGDRDHDVASADDRPGSSSRTAPGRSGHDRPGHGGSRTGVATAALLASLALAACTDGPNGDASPAPGAGGVAVPMQLRAIDQGTLRLSGTIAGQTFSLDAPEPDGRWIIRMTVPSEESILATLTWSTGDGLILATLVTDLPPVRANGSLRIDATGYVIDHDEDDDRSSNVEEVRCGSDPYEPSSRPTAGEDCGAPAPPDDGTGDALERLRSDGRFPLFVDAVESSGRQSLLASAGTVFAPTDAAIMQSLTSGQYGAQSDAALGLLVDRHVLPGRTLAGADLLGLTGNNGGITANDGSGIDLDVTSAGDIEYGVLPSPSGGSVAAAARVDALDFITAGSTIVHRVESLVSIDHALAIDYVSLPPDFSANCFRGINTTELPRNAGAFPYTFNVGGTSIIWQDVTLTERARIAVRHIDGTPSDSGAVLYDENLAVVAANDDPDTLSSLRFLLESTVLEPGAYCLAYGHYQGEAVPVPGTGWAGSVEVVTFTTSGVN